MVSILLESGFPLCCTSNTKESTTINSISRSELFDLSGEPQTKTEAIHRARGKNQSFYEGTNLLERSSDSLTDSGRFCPKKMAEIL